MMRRVARGLAIATLIGAASLPAADGAREMEFSSGPAHVTLIELFTSEGCSSCPPAEKWLGALRDDVGLWKTFVPVAFHVDYWNRLGWPDRFSSREFTQRQYAYAATWPGESVYTPCFVRDGREWAASSTGLRKFAPPSAAATDGTLMVRFDGATVRAVFSPATDGDAESKHAVPKRFELHAALLGSGIVSAVRAGENRGATLRHEFVALALAAGPLERPLPLAVPAVDGVQRHALAVWITRVGELAPLQAVGGWCTE